jgi:thiamine biosynthesis lipoprotein
MMKKSAVSSLKLRAEKVLRKSLRDFSILSYSGLTGVSREKGLDSPIKSGNDGLVSSLMAFLFIVCCTLSILLFSCTQQKDRIYRKTMIRMDTLVTINVVAGSEEKADRAMERAFGEVGKLDTLLNFFSDGSELSAINRNAGIGPVQVSPETMEVIEKAVSASGKTGGAFDVTIGPESSLWNFSTKQKPDDRKIREKLGLVNYQWIAIDKERSAVELRKKGMLMDLGAIAKGYAADKAVEALKKSGIKSALVAVAGDIRAYGLKPDGKPWRVGIRNPRQKGKDDETVATVELRDMAISTAGDYERYFILDGKRYHHILDPGTGYPAGGCQSVTVMARDGVSADAFDTAIFVLGPEKGLEVMRQMGFEGIIIDKEGKISATPGMKDAIELKRSN